MNSFSTNSVATVLTVYGIETRVYKPRVLEDLFVLQQYLPFTVLKPCLMNFVTSRNPLAVATVLTVYGIETRSVWTDNREDVPHVATVLTVYGIETMTADNICAQPF